MQTEAERIVGTFLSQYETMNSFAISSTSLSNRCLIALLFNCPHVVHSSGVMLDADRIKRIITAIDTTDKAHSKQDDEHEQAQAGMIFKNSTTPAPLAGYNKLAAAAAPTVPKRNQMKMEVDEQDAIQCHNEAESKLIESGQWEKVSYPEQMKGVTKRAAEDDSGDFWQSLDCLAVCCCTELTRWVPVRWRIRQ